MKTVSEIDAEQWVELRERVYSEFRARGANRYADWKITLKLTFLYLLVGGSYTAIYLLTPSALWLSLWPVLGISIFFLIVNCSHDASHGCLFRSKRINRFILQFNFALLGIDGSLWGLRHLSAHHPHTNVSGEDPDSIPNKYLRLSPHHPWHSWFRWQMFYAPFLYALAFLHTAWVQDFDHLIRRPLPYLEDLKNPLAVALRMFAVKLFYLITFVFLPWIVGGIPAGDLLFGILLSQISASLVFVLTICLNHYVCETVFFAAKGKATNQHLSHQLISCADWHATNPYVCALMGGANAHTAHHLFPAFSHRHYPWVSEIIRDFTRERELPYNSFSFSEGLRSHFRFLHEQGRRPRAV